MPTTLKLELSSIQDSNQYLVDFYNLFSFQSIMYSNQTRNIQFHNCIHRKDWWFLYSNSSQMQIFTPFYFLFLLLISFPVKKKNSLYLCSKWKNMTNSVFYMYSWSMWPSIINVRIHNTYFHISNTFYFTLTLCIQIVLKQHKRISMPSD